MATTTLTNLEGVLRIRDAGYKRGLRDARQQAQGFRQTLGRVAGGMDRLATVGAVAMVPVVAGMRNAVRQSHDFNRAMANVHSLVGTTGDEAKRLNQQILEMGGNTEHGPMRTAQAFYDIVSGISDASTHMAVLEASMRTATAGQADLTATTSAMVGIMNAYGFAADKATFVSDVLTRSVQTGVLTMDQLAQAMPQVTGLAASMNIDLENVAMSLSALTKGGYSAAQSATFIKAMMTSLLNPTGKLKEAIEDLGYSSGEQLLKTEGLLGGYSELYEHLKGSFAGVITNTEALQGAMALMSDSSLEFFAGYREGLDGATAAGEAIQEQAISWEKLDSKMQQLWITVGDRLAPTLNKLLDQEIIPGINALIGFWTEGDNATNSLKVLGFAAGAITFAKLVAGLKAVLAIAGGVIAALNSIVALAGALGIAAGGAGLIAGQKAGNMLATLTMGGQNLAPGENRFLQAIMRTSGAGLSEAQFNEQLFKYISAERGDFQGRIGFGAMRTGLMYDAYQRGTGATGYAMGGYTGYGNRNQIAGMVHRGEYVVPQGGALVLRGGNEAAAQVAVYGPVSVNADNAEEFAREMVEAVRSL